MKTIGIIGGLGPESTYDYYKNIIDAFKPTYATKGFPHILIDCLDLKSFVKLAEDNEWEQIISLLSDRFERLRQSGAEFGAIASNSPHKVFNEVQKRTALPLISIVNATCSYINGIKIKSVALLGTQFTMQSDFYSKELENYGIKTIVPDSDDIRFIQNKLMTEIELGIVKDSTKKAFLNIINKLRGKNDIEGLVLGCTELPLIIKENDIDMKYIDSSRIHIDAIIKECTT